MDVLKLRATRSGDPETPREVKGMCFPIRNTSDSGAGVRHSSTPYQGIYTVSMVSTEAGLTKHKARRCRVLTIGGTSGLPSRGSGD